MMRLAAFAIGITWILAAPLHAGERQYLGYGRLVTNDLIGDTHDRWRTGSIASSRVWGPEWNGEMPRGFGQLLELRFNGEIIAPEDLGAPAAGDRPYAGMLSLGLHTHYRAGEAEISIGADLAVTGPQTGLDHFQSFVHDLIDAGEVSSGVRDAQIGNGLRPTLVVEAGRDFALGGNGRIRPFVEGRLGIEDMVRVGADITIGPVGQGGLMVRAPVTGQRYRVIENSFQGTSFVVGGDVAYVDDSDLLPSGQGYSVTDMRTRLRAGLHWETANGSSGFYGLTWLDKEFDTQREAQVVGSVRLNLQF